MLEPEIEHLAEMVAPVDRLSGLWKHLVEKVEDLLVEPVAVLRIGS